MSELLESLNEAQRRAVATTEGPVLVLAGPGSGKTRVLAHRIAYMVKDKSIAPWRIMAVTFTNKAAGEMRERVERLIDEDVRDLRLGTFHAVCARILRSEVDAIPYKSSFAIYDTADQKALIKNILVEMQKDPKQHRPGAILASISAAKNELIMPEDFPTVSYKDEITQAAYRKYMVKLQQNNGMDFDDLLMQTVLLFRQNSDVLEKYHRWFQYFMVDEFQDTNMAQYELVKLLSRASKNLFVVGDPDQSIYAFRGADYRNVKRFQEDFPELKLVTLDENYRSHQLILDAAMAVIRKDPSHIKRDLFSQRINGPLIEDHELHNESAESDFIVNQIIRLQREEGYVPSDFAIMYRTNAQSRALEEAFLRMNMPYRIVGGVRFYERKEIKDLLAYLRLVNNPDDTISLARIINTPTRGIGKKTEGTLLRWIEDKGLGQWAVLRAIIDGRESPLTGRALNTVRDFADMVERWILLSQEDEASPLKLIDTILEDTRYMDSLDSNIKGGEEERIENINELRRRMADYEGFSLSHVLEDISLVADIDTLDDDTEAPTMMTLHSAKGLEYPVVFLIGLEEGLLPHERSMQDPSQMSEERRLMYVGITRAKDRLYLLHTNMRGGFTGGYDYRDPSRFLNDLPDEIVTRHSPWQAQRDAYRQQHNFMESTKLPYSIPTRPKSERVSIEGKFTEGMSVYHKIFGKGIVLKTKTEGSYEQVEVDFEKYGVKKLDGSFLQKG